MLVYNESVVIRGRWGVLPIMAYTGRLRLKGVPFSGLRYMKGREVYERVGNLSLRSVKGPKGLKDESYGFIKTRKRSILNL